MKNENKAQLITIVLTFFEFIWTAAYGVAHLKSIHDWWSFPLFLSAMFCFIALSGIVNYKIVKMVLKDGKR